MISCSNQIQDTSCRNPVSGIRYLVSGIQHPVSSIEYSASNIRYPASGIRHRGSSIENPASRIKHPASSIQHPASGFTLLEVLIAMAIMAVVLVSVYRLHSQTLTMTTTTGFIPRRPCWPKARWHSWRRHLRTWFQETPVISGTIFPAMLGAFLQRTCHLKPWGKPLMI